MIRFLRRAALAGAVIFLVYGLLLAFPEPLFAHRIVEGPLIRDSREPIENPSPFAELLEEAFRVATETP